MNPRLPLKISEILTNCKPYLRKRFTLEIESAEVIKTQVIMAAFDYLISVKAPSEAIIRVKDWVKTNPAATSPNETAETWIVWLTAKAKAKGL